MKQRFTVMLCCVGLVVGASHAGLFKNSVDLADLSEASIEKLETLKETEFAVFVAQVNLNTAKAAGRRAAGGVKAANRTLEAENLDMKAAKAEEKAAEANLDQERMTTAGARITGATEDLATAKALRKWKSQEQEVFQAQVAAAKSALDVAEARRDLARLRLLAQEAGKFAEKYDVNDFEKNVARREREYTAAEKKARERADKTQKLKSEWDRLAKNDPFRKMMDE